MEDACRKHIVKNMDKLIELTDYNNLKVDCQKWRLLSAEMCRIIENMPLSQCSNLSEEGLQYERHRRLLMKITKRGPDAYQMLKNLLIAQKCDAAVRLLNQVHNDDSHFTSISQSNRRVDTTPVSKPVEVQPQINEYNTIVDDTTYIKEQKSEESPPRLELCTDIVQPKATLHVNKSEFVHSDPKIGSYSMKSKSDRGVFFMVNILDFPNEKDRRNGAGEDEKSLLYLFNELGFKSFAYKNLTQNEFFETLDIVIQSDYMHRAECFVMVIMTHGDSDENHGERVQFHDGAIVKVREIENRFENRRCANLVNKPKILIFPFCRGDRSDDGHYRTIETDSIAERKIHAFSDNIPTLDNLCICYASLRGFRAHRDPSEGSWYIQTFCKLMAEHAHNTHFEDILKMINNETSNMRTPYGALQTGNYSNLGFNKKLFFNPGAWEEDSG